MFADVIVDIANSEVDKIFEYFVCDDMLVSAGSRVKVPFGNKLLDGIVISLKETSSYEATKIKPISFVLDEVPALTEETLSLAKYLAKTYFVPMASSLRLFLPTEMRKGKVKEKIENYYVLNDGFSLQVEIELLRKTAIKQKQFLEYIFNEKECKSSFAHNNFGQGAVRPFINKGLVKIVSRQVTRPPYQDLVLSTKKVELTEAQKEAIYSIKTTNKQTSIIFGVTGSGKTEVYLKLIDDALSANKTAIMLVPEIALTPQMFRQLKGRFGDNVAILHSGLSAGEKFDEWWRLRNGEAKIAVGARSAIFAPLSNLGIIVIDEEHDGSYTSESSPRYCTIDIAKFRASYSNSKLVLGSATPSIETFLRAKNGEYNLIELKNRINKRPLPKAIVADMRKEIRRGNNSPFSSVLVNELEECLSKKNQAIIFLNQRGYSKSVICTECGHVQKCKDCDVSLTYHIEDNALLCHYCGAKYKMISACTECGSKFIRHGGFGTERVVLELKKLFPKARILRMDRDTTQNKEGHLKILSDFSEKKADILVGTQMIAKGHDFPSVTLVGILDADMSLHFSDYRSSERTFQLITQVAGRSGRAEEVGKVVLQTYSPDNLVLRYAINYDYIGFYNYEVSIRKATAFPPYTDIIRVLIASEKEELALESTKRIYQELSEVYNSKKEHFRFFGCMKAPLKRLQNRFRFQVLMRINSNNRKLIENIHEIIKKYDKKPVLVAMEINPNNLN